MKNLQQMVDQLNLALQLDPNAITSLANYRVPVNDALLEDENCSLIVLEGEGQWLIGLVGVLNGFRDEDDPVIAAVYDEQDESKLLRFTLIEKVPGS